MTPTATMPDWLEPMAATLTQERFVGPEWVFERKFDGIRLLAYKRGADVHVYSRNRLAQHLPAITRAVASLPVHEVILDGEVTWDGGSYHVFDILWLNTRLVTALPLEKRRALLQQLPFEGPIQRVELLDDEEPWERARREGWEGVMAKRRGSPYEHRRSKHWLKMKCEASQELLVGGFTDPQGSRVGLGALLVGYHDGPRSRLCRESWHRLRHKTPAASSKAARRTGSAGIALYVGHGPAPAACPLGAPRHCRPGRVHRMDHAWKAAAPETARRPRRHGRAPRDTRAAVITHPEKVLFPEDGITKGELARYYETLTPVILPHLRGRPITMERYPAGIGKKGFWQKDVSKGFPAWLQRVTVPKKDGVVHHPVVTDARSLLWITNQNAITHHVWTSRIPRLEYPDLCVFDLDPSTEDVAAVRAAAIGLRDLLETLGLPSWIKTSGSKGFHIVVPVDGKTEMETVARFADGVGKAFVTLAPDRLTQEFSKADRRGRIYVDTGRNGYSATCAAVYTVRAKDGAPVSAPCTWDEIERGEVEPRTFTLRNMPERVATVGDLWADMRRRGRSLTRPMETLRRLMDTRR